MKNLIETITTRLLPITSSLRRHRVTIFIVTFLGIYVLLVMRINGFINDEPDQAALSGKLQTVQRLKVDQESVDRIQKLEEQNVDVKALFQQARQNPFNE